MATGTLLRYTGLKIIKFLIIALFVYTAISKIRDFEIFRVRLDQSPMLEGFGDLLAIIIPAALLAIAILLLLERSQKLGLYASLGLMSLFTAYIAIVLSFFSSSLPCSCNGVFEGMSWKQHLWFNIGFIVLVTIRILLDKSDEKVLQLQPP